MWVNEKWCEITGYSFHNALGEGWRKALHPEDIDRIFNEWKECSSIGQLFCSEYRFLRPDGDIRASVAADGTPLPRAGWTPYGLGPVLDHEAFVTELLSATAAAGIPLEQLHAKFFASTVEFSLPPATPLQAADGVVLARLITGRLARKHNLRASFSPFPISGGGGNAAHVHYSFSRNGEPLFSGGDGPHGMTTDGASSIAGVIAALPGIQGILGGSILSGARLRPRVFSGAYACWGRENRGAAVR